MKEQFSSNTIKDIITRDGVNYVAFAVTNWHLIGAKAGEEYLRAKGIDVNPLYIIEGHPQQGYLDIDEGNLNIVYHDCNERYHIWRYIKTVFCTICMPNGNKDTLYIGCPWIVDPKKVYVTGINKNVRFITYEEGAKSYNRQYEDLFFILRNYSLGQSANILLTLSVNKILKWRSLLQNINPLQRNNGKLALCPEAIECYRKASSIYPITLDRKVVLFVMQSLEPEYIRVIEELIPHLESWGMQVFIKPHPRFPLDGIKLSNATLINDNRSLETLMPDIKSQYVLGFFSTALLSTRYFFDATTISLYDMMIKDKISTEVNDLLEWFKATFSDVVEYPKNIDEIKEIILNRK